MAKSIECKCESNFTCGFCLRNAKPYFFTPRTSQEILHAQINAKTGASFGFLNGHVEFVHVKD